MAGVQDLLNRQERAAQEAHKILLSAIAAQGSLPEQIELGCATDDHEAQSIGWPTASAQMAMTGRLLGKLDPEHRALVKVVPRGSTPATAAAEI